MSFIPKMQEWFNIYKSVNHINRTTNKNHVHLNRCEVFEKNLSSLPDKTSDENKYRTLPHTDRCQL